MFCQYLKNTYKNTGELHHAYLIEGDNDEVFLLLKKFLEEDLAFSTQGNPDFWKGNFETFGIDDGRHLKEMQSNRAFGDRKIFVISFDFITIEAQNSLLKIFEEPTENTHFFIITSSAESLLPTLKSRLMIVTRPAKGGASHPDMSDFLSSSLSKRLDIVKKFVDDDSKNKSDAISFLVSLEIALREKIPPQNIKQDDIFVFEEILKCKSYLNDRSASVKMILEHISLITPMLLK